MVNRKNLKKKYALVSVYNKSKLQILCKSLKKYNYKIISTGSTFKKIKSLGYDCYEISKLSKTKEILDGRVKTLNQKVFGSILHLRKNTEHKKEFKSLKFPEINMVVVNLYPFEKISNKADKDTKIEMIDIGGPSMVRAASKNYEFVTAVSGIGDYERLIENLKKNNGNTDLNFRRKLAKKNFLLTSEYDKRIFEWFKGENKYEKRISLRYGENPSQKSYYVSKNKNSIFNFQISGKQISYNNIIDVDSGLNCLNEFSEPTCIIVKHTNMCSAASSSKILDAFKKAYLSDSKSAFGGIVLVNRKIDSSLAHILSKNFFEIIVASDFTNIAKEILSIKKNLILLKIKKYKKNNIEFKSTLFGNLYQYKDNTVINKNFIKPVSIKTNSIKIIDDLIFSLKIVKHLKSNAIVLSKNKQTVGIGCGETNRVDAVRSALSKMKKSFSTKNFVCASDGFFPFVDSIKLLKKSGCKAITQPSGSKNDYKVINYSIKHKMPLYFAKNRLFKH